MISRYSLDPVYGSRKQYGSPRAVVRIREAIRAGTLRTKTRILREGERLDILAGEEYDDSTMWWVLAAASNIGWGLQVPAGTIILVPDHGQTIELLR